jgi:hypothetical protein
MSQIGTVVTNQEVPAATSAAWDTANAFFIGLSDWGPVGPVTIQSQPGVAAVVGPRSGTNTTSYDALDVFFREGGGTAFFSRVVGPAASAATLTLKDGASANALLISAAYYGNYGNQIQLSVNNAGASFTVFVTDTYGNALVTSPALASRAAAVAWGATIGYINVIAYGGSATLPATAAATTLSGGTDDRAHVTLTQYGNAVNAFPSTLGPGQVAAPGATNTTVPGIWTQIAAHALSNNRVAIGDMDDGAAASVAISALGAAYQSAAVGPIGFWSGNLSAPGVVPNTTRSIPPSAVIAALCSRVDGTGNPNLAGAGSSFPLQYCTGSFTLVSGITETYNATDTSSLNSAGINAFANRFGVFENFGFVSSIPPSTDVIYWQFNHARLRMAISAAAQQLAEQFLFSQLDGQGSDILAFATALTAMLMSYYQSGALYGATASQAFSVNTGPTVNTPTSLQAGQLNALLSVRMSPFAELIDIVVNSVPITVSVPTGNAASS